MAFGGNPTVLGSGLPIATGGVSVVSGPASSTDNAIVRWNGTGGNLIQNSVNILSDNGDLSLPSTATLGLQLYNTADQTTNYERLEVLWSSNQALIETIQGGSGTARNLLLRATQSGGNNASTITLAGIAGTGIEFRKSTAQAAAMNVFVFNNTSLTNTSGTSAFVSITPTYNQASGTAANTDLLINRTETAVGSGTQRLIDAQVGGSSRFSVSNVGTVAVASGAFIGFGSRSFLSSASDGVLMVSNSAATDFSRLQFGGTTSSFPAWVRNSTSFEARLADVSALTNVYMSHLDIQDGISAPGTDSGRTRIYVDTSDGDLKVKFGDGTIKTIVTDT